MANFITLRQVGYRLPCGRQLFDQLDFTFQGRRIGLVGPNGAGKSILATLLAGARTPTQGRIERKGAVRYMAQHLEPGSGGSVAGLAGQAELWNAMQRIEQGAGEESDFALMDGKWDKPVALKEALARAGVAANPGSPAAALSGGLAMRAALAGALQSDAEILLLDEPGNHLDIHGRQWLLEELAAWRGMAIVISHDRALLESMDTIVELSQGKLQTYGGNYSAYAQQRANLATAAQDALTHAMNARAAGLRKLRLQHDREQERSARNARAGKVENIAPLLRGMRKASAEVFAGREKKRRAESLASLNQAVHLAAERLAHPDPVALLLPQTRVPAAKRIIELENFTPPWPSHAAPIDLVLSGPVRVAVTGPNGCGKSTLLSVIAAHAKVPHARLDQLGSALLKPSECVLDALSRLGSTLTEGELRSNLALLGLTARHVSTPTVALSGGERIKAALACALWQRQPAQLLLLDEPTNHLDLHSVEALEHALQDYHGAIIAVSHDEHFLANLNPTHALAWVGATWQLTQHH